MSTQHHGSYRLGMISERLKRVLKKSKQSLKQAKRVAKTQETGDGLAEHEKLESARNASTPGVAEIAAQADINEADINCLLQAVARSIIKDGAAEALLDADEAFQIEAFRAYAHSEIEKFKKFQTTMMTNPQARSEFGLVVLGLLK